MSARLSGFLASACTATLLFACAPKPGDTGGEGVQDANFSGTAPDWALEDVNATSPTFGEVVSPSDLRGQVSVWYFGHST